MLHTKGTKNVTLFNVQNFFLINLLAYLQLSFENVRKEPLLKHVIEVICERFQSWTEDIPVIYLSSYFIHSSVYTFLGPSVCVGL
jgi:hypothetical protein